MPAGCPAGKATAPPPPEMEVGLVAVALPIYSVPTDVGPVRLVTAGPPPKPVEAIGVEVLVIVVVVVSVFTWAVSGLESLPILPK